jgi:hypothetical protein
MFDWLAKKGQNSRVYMCIKEVKWDLEVAAPLKRATILALAQLLRADALSEAGLSADVLDRPLDYCRDHLMRYYELLETWRNSNILQIEAVRANMRRLGMILPTFAVDHATTTGRALEIWMCTLGAGIVTERRDDVRAIWSYLSCSLNNLDQAFQNLQELEQKTAAMTGSCDTSMFSTLDISDWKDLCRFVPSAFAKELHF